MGSPEFVANWFEVRVAFWGSLNLWLVSEVRAILWELFPLTLHFDLLIVVDVRSLGKTW